MTPVWPDPFCSRYSGSPLRTNAAAPALNSVVNRYLLLPNGVLSSITDVDCPVSSVGGYEIMPGGGHVGARWWSRVLPVGGRLICLR